MTDARIAYTPRQAAEAANLTEPQIWQAITSHALKAHMAGDRVIVLRAELERYVASLPGPLDGFDHTEARRQASIKEADAKRARGRAIAEQALGKAPAAAPKPAAERERGHQERIAHETAARARGRAIVEKAKGTK